MLYQSTLDSIKALKKKLKQKLNPLQKLLIQDAAVLFHLCFYDFKLELCFFDQV